MVCRYVVVQATIKMGWTGLPFGTLFVNLLGSFLIGFLSLWLLQKAQLSHAAQVIVLSGFLGGFTTFSAFSLETLKMLNSAQFDRALAYVGLSVSLSIFCCFAGLLLAKRLI